jgi:SP family arabinose:H+ symporter-like MFS transporter
VCLCAALGGLLFGFDIAVVSGTVSAVRQQFALTPWIEGLFVASALIGCTVGSTVSGPIGDRIGRKRGLVIASILFIVTGLGCAFAPDRLSLLIFRFFGGVGIGISSVICPLYISEVSPARVRGRMVTLFQFAITIGICASLFSNASLEWISRHSTPGARDTFYRWMFVDQFWRAMFWVGTLPAALFALATLFIPESPRWLAMVGREGQALDVLKRIEGKDAADESLRNIRAAITSRAARFTDLLHPGPRKALGVAVFLALMSQFSGITVVLYYGPDILNQAGVQLSAALGGFIIIGLVKMLFTVIALWSIDRVGRRPLLFWGTIGCCTALASLGALFSLHRSNGIVLVALICLFCAFFAFSLGPVKWVVMSEIFPTRIRGRAVAVGTTAVWLADAVSNYLFPWARDLWGPAVCFFAFALALLPQILFVRFIMPETKGRALEEIGQARPPANA